MAKLRSPTYLGFPLSIDPATSAPRLSGRGAHVREQIEQVLFTNPRERVLRPEFGAGVLALVFEPNTAALAEVTKQRLMSSLAESLRGEVDPRSLTIDVERDGVDLRIVICYTLATIGQTERQEFLVGPGS